MRTDRDDLVRVRAGSLTQIEYWHELLEAAGVESRVVGDALLGGLGTAVPNSVELWIHRADAAAAEAAMAGAEKHHQWSPESHPIPPHGHPTSDPKPDHSRGPTHGAPPHRPLPS